MKNQQSKLDAATKRCRAAFAKHPKARWAWCCHHAVLYEYLSEPAENRIQYILSYKPVDEQVVRLNNFRPVTNAAKFAPLMDDYNAKLALRMEDYDAKLAPLIMEYRVKCAPLMAVYNSKCASLGADSKSKRHSLWLSYISKSAPIVADFNAKCAPLMANFKAKCAPLQKPLLKLYRRDVPFGTWTGRSIFIVG